MRRYWGHVAMLLLGISLTVGFYEGRQLVQNTAKALSVATTITVPSARDREPRDEVVDDELPVEREDEPGAVRAERKRKPGRMVPVAPPGEPERRFAPAFLPSRGRADLQRARIAPNVRLRRLTEVEPVEEVLDTGLVQPPAPR